MGEVYRAVDTRLDREVALKLLPPDMAHDPERRRRFKDEARGLAALSHPNIVTLFSVEEAEGLHFMTMELVVGRSLRSRIEEGPLPFELLLHLGLQVCDGLGSAHRRGVLHRDLKPENVMITGEGPGSTALIKILDFGLAKLLGRPNEIPASDPESATLSWQGTLPGATLGTAAYMSPEQALGEDIDGRTDLFALGVLLYEMATGTNPFRAATLAGTFDRILHHAPPPASRIATDLPAAFDSVVERAIAKPRERRYSSIQDLLVDLQELRDGGTVTVTPAATVPRSVVVLPFTDMSPLQDQAYLCHGLAEELINALAQVRDLRVVARTSAFAAREQGLELGELGRRLDVETVLEGSVRKSGKRLRIAVQLVRTSDSSQLWSQRFDRDMEDVFAVQDEIAAAVAEKLEQRGATETGPSTEDAAVYDLYLRGLYAMNLWTEEAVRRAIRHFEEVTEAEPDFAPAHAALAESLIFLFSSLGIAPARETVPRARAAAQRALELDSRLAEAHRSLGLIAMNHDWDRLGARRGFERALELSPGSSSAHLWNAWRLTLLEGDFEAALGGLERAEELDPLHLQIKTLIGYVHLFRRDYAAARRQFQRVLEIDGAFAFAHYAAGDVAMHEGQFAEAMRSFEESMRLGGRSANNLGVLACCCGRAGDEERARALLAELEALAERGYTSAMWHALAHLGLGDVERTFAHLERAFAERDGSLVLLTVAPELDPLRSDPRFESLLARMGLEDRSPR